VIYRKEIDGLRALAVIPVIMFHAGFDLFSGGYVGVDIFFVISGYLITSIILAEKKSGTFSLIGFYERRARRILPALYFVIIICIPFSWFWMMPGQLKDFSESVVAVSVFVSNILFFFEDGYFARAAELKPLLHTWSLAVEEQYYVIFPIFMILFWKFGKRRLVAIITLVGLLSFGIVISGYAYRNVAVSNFYLTPSRAWELIIGALLAFHHYFRTQTNSNYNHFAAIVGFFLIIYSIFAFDKTTPFPSTYSLIPTVGAALIILYATPDTFIGKLLSLKGFVGIGLISYSAYLWHQPLFAFARLRSTGEPNVWLFLVLIIITLILAYLSWRYIECPFRNKQKIVTKQIVYGVVVVSFLLIGVGISGIHSNGFIDRFDRNTQVAIESFEKDEKSNCRNTEKFSGLLSNCGFGNLDKNKLDVIIIGDSHARSLRAGFDEFFGKNNLSGVYLGEGGSFPLYGATGVDNVNNIGPSRKVTEEYKKIYHAVEKYSPPVTVLIARWPLSWHTTRPNGSSRTNSRYVITDEHKEFTLESSQMAFKESFIATIRKLSLASKQVIIFSSIPYVGGDPKRCFVMSVGCNFLSTIDVIQRNKDVNEFMLDATKELDNVSFINLSEKLCLKNSLTCTLHEKNFPVFKDATHFTVDGSRDIIERLSYVELMESFSKADILF